MPKEPTREEEIEKLAALALAPLVEIAWADGRVTPSEREAVLEAARAIGVGQRTDFCRSTLMRWLHEAPPTRALTRWRELLSPILSESDSRIARKSERRLLEHATHVAKTDEIAFKECGAVEIGAGISPDEQRVLDELAQALGSYADGAPSGRESS